jgi:hypothetical protein
MMMRTFSSVSGLDSTRMNLPSTNLPLGRKARTRRAREDASALVGSGFVELGGYEVFDDYTSCAPDRPAMPLVFVEL